MENSNSLEGVNYHSEESSLAMSEIAPYHTGYNTGDDSLETTRTRNVLKISKFRMFQINYLSPYLVLFLFGLVIAVGHNLHWREKSQIMIALPIFIFFTTIIAYLHKKYKFRMRASECIAFFDDVERVFKEFDFGDGYHCKEIFDRDNRFKYTEIIVLSPSIHKCIIEDNEVYKAKRKPQFVSDRFL